MRHSFPYEGTVDNYSYEWLCTKDGLHHDYVVSDPNGTKIRMNGLSQNEAYKMSLNPKAYYDKCLHDNTQW